MNNIDALKARLLVVLKEKSFHKQKVKLASGLESDYYIDARVTTLSAEGAYLAAKIMIEMAKGEKIKAIGGPTLGADPLAGAIAAVSFQEGAPIDTFIVRKAVKAHGRQKRVEGAALEKGDEVILIDDVATTGGSIIDAIEALKEIGARAGKAFCVVDRLQGAAENLRKSGCELIPIFTSKDFGV